MTLGSGAGSRAIQPAMPEAYLWIKALHVAAVLTWMAGMIVAPAVIARENGRGCITALRRHYSRVTTPAMILALALGLWLAQDGDWFRAGWLQAKLALVFGLTGVHGLLSGQMRRIDAGATRGASPWIARLSPAVILAVLAIAILVIVKPAPW